MKNVAVGSAIAGAILLLSAPAGFAVAIDAQFSATASLQQSGAAVIGAAGDYWNYSNASSSTVSLLGTNQAATGITMTFAASGGAYSSTSGSSAFAATSYANLMQGYLYSNTTGTMTLTLKGLAAGQGFSLDLYTQGDANASGRSSAVTVNGSSATSTQTNAATFIQGNNYLVFSGVADALGYVSIGVVAKSGEANLNGLQLLTTAVPEPSTFALVGVGLIGLCLMNRRRQLS